MCSLIFLVIVFNYVLCIGMERERSGATISQESTIASEMQALIEKKIAEQYSVEKKIGQIKQYGENLKESKGETRKDNFEIDEIVIATALAEQEKLDAIQNSLARETKLLTTFLRDYLTKMELHKSLATEAGILKGTVQLQSEDIRNLRQELNQSLSRETGLRSLLRQREEETDRALKEAASVWESILKKALGYLKEKEYKVAMNILEVVANQEKHRGIQLEATYHIGIMYYYGHGVSQCYEVAAGRFNQVVSDGRASGIIKAKALYYLGCMCNEGKGTPLNYAEARRYFERVLELGIESDFVRAEALYQLGLMWFQGKDCDKNLAVARDTLELVGKASTTSEWVRAEALYHLALISYHDKNYSEAKNLFVRTINEPTNSGWAEAQALYFLGQMHYKGVGIAQDYGKALYFFQMAVEKTKIGWAVAESLYHIAHMYWHGHGLTRDSKKAKELFERVCNTETTSDWVHAAARSHLNDLR